MLKHLSIRNYILIRELEMSFHEGYSCITGETGAGKSIFLGALGLLLGERADTTSISDQNSKCVIEGTFEPKGVVDKSFFEENELDYDSQCIIRREILPHGKSRAFINDTPVGLNVLKILGEKIIDIHSQHSTMLLTKNTFHLSLLDAVAGTTETYAQYTSLWNTYKNFLTKLETLKNELELKEKDRDYLNFLFQEIEELGTAPGESAELEEKHSILKNAESIKSVLGESYSTLKFSDVNICDQLHRLGESLSAMSKVYPSAEEYAARIQSTNIELQDIANDLLAIDDKVLVDPGELEQTELRLDRIRKLLFKHKLNETDQLIELQNELSSKLSQIDLCSDSLVQLEKEIETFRLELHSIAVLLSEKRTKVKESLEKEIERILSSLAMPNARFKVVCNTSEQLTFKGYDDVRFYFSANLGEEPQELSKVASGGEMSRVMLALKSVIANSLALPSLVFDEIDTGISGETAKKMASIFVEMGRKIQLIVITHLPQIASRASHHMVVRKIESGNTTHTVMDVVEKENRTKEIAKMLGGEQYSQAALQTADEMLKAHL